MPNNNINNGLFDRIPPTIPVLNGGNLEHYLEPLQRGRDVSNVQPLTAEQIQTIVEQTHLGNLNLRVGELFGQGGFATVYALEDQNTAEQYALKVLDPLFTSVHRFLRNKPQTHAKISRDDVEPLIRDYRYFFERDAGEITIGQAINETQCPNLMPYTFFCEVDAGEILKLGYNRIVWLIGMPSMLCLPDGFHDIQEKVGITESLILKCGVDLCYALETMHKIGRHTAIDAQENNKNGNFLYIRPDHPEKSLIHRDVKPGNIYIRIQNVNQKESAYSIDFVLADYGISRILDRGQWATKIAPDVFKAPELSLDQEVSPVTDLYSVATVMLWLLWKENERETFRSLQRACREAYPQLVERREKEPYSYVEQILSLLDKVWGSTLVRTEIQQNEKADILKIASRDICRGELLQQLLAMRSIKSTDRPWQSAEDMRNALEQYRLTLTAPLQKEQQKVQDLQKETENLRQKHAALEKEKSEWIFEALNRAEENQALQRQVNQLADEVENLRQNGVPQQKEMQKEAESLRRENEGLKQQRAELLHESATKKENVEGQEREKLKIKIDALRFARDKLDAETKKQEIAIKVLRRQIADQQAEIQTLNREKDALSGQVADQQKKILTLTWEKDALSSQAEALRETADETSQQDFARQAADWKDRYLKLRKELKESLDEKRANEFKSGAVILSESVWFLLLSIVSFYSTSYFFSPAKEGASFFLVIVFGLGASLACSYGFHRFALNKRPLFSSFVREFFGVIFSLSFVVTALVVTGGFLFGYFDVPSWLMQIFGLS